ncbi:DUF192 domain-containing protein [Candidatus Micrarchaeota archaeon]|nr:DUF192 domain-containing protein [Candidatus Micrarchaeota archaeon]
MNMQKMLNPRAILVALAILALLLLAFSFYHQLQQNKPHSQNISILILPDGFQVKAELALTPEQQAKGLMFRASLREDEGMLFIFPSNYTPSFWMKNTLVPLDIVFLDENMKAIALFENVPPCTTEQCAHYYPNQPSSFALELPSFTARKHDLTENSKINYAK